MIPTAPVDLFFASTSDGLTSKRGQLANGEPAASWRLRFACYLALLIWICAPYFAMQHSAPGAAHVMQPGALDRLIPFDPRWTAIYLSLYVFLPLAPLLYSRRDEVLRFCAGLFCLVAVAHTAFWLAPTRVPHPTVPSPHGLYAWMVSVDGTRNACPSLHAALAVFAAAAWWRLASPARPSHAHGPYIVGIYQVYEPVGDSICGRLLAC
jgi:hypothetical protein